MPQEIKPRRPSSGPKAGKRVPEPAEAVRQAQKTSAARSDAKDKSPAAAKAKGSGGKAAKGEAGAAKTSSARKATAKASSAKTPVKAAPLKKGAKGTASRATSRATVSEPVPKARRRAVANAAAAVHGRTVAAWTKKEIVEAFTRFEAQDPEPQGELEHTDPFTLLVAVVLSAQATDAGVNKATRGLFAAASTPQAMAALGEEKVAHFIRTLGLYKGKAKNVVELSRLLLERHGGTVPQDREALEALPGVGRKTANVVLNIAFGVPTIAVDTHLFRVANRTGLAPGPTPLAVELGLEERIPAQFKLHAHHWLILHGRYICKATKPACGRCIIADLCRWPDKTP